MRPRATSTAPVRSAATAPITDLIRADLASSSDGPPLLAASQRSGSVRATRRHRHERGQLLGAVEGLLSVEAGDCRWVVPATHAVWIPPNLPHGLRSHGPFSGWSLYVRRSGCADLPAVPCILGVTGLLREAVARAVTWNTEALSPDQTRLAAVMLDEIRGTPAATLGLPMPKDTRLTKIARALCDRPDDTRGLDEWAAWAGIAPRSLTRRFTAETGFSFTAWRQRVRLLRALELLAAGRPVAAIASDLGYDNTSAFIALFRRTFGTTPGRFNGRGPAGG